MDVIAASQTEILLFFVAIALHTLLFSKHTVKLNPNKAKTSSPSTSPRNLQKPAHPVSNNVLPVLKAAIQESNLTAAMSCIQNIPVTAPPMPQKMAQALVRLSSDEGKLVDFTQFMMERGPAGASALVAILAESGQQLSAVQSLADAGVLEDLVTMTPRDTQIAFLKAVGSTQNWKLAQTTFDACASKTSSHFNVLIDAYLSGRQVAAAERLLHQAVELGVADANIYSTIIRSSLQCGSWKKTRSILDGMRANGVQPNTATLNEVLDHLVKTDFETAWRLFEEMRAWGVKPNCATCSILLKSLQTCSNSTHADRVLKVVDIIEDGMDDVLLASVLEACIRINRADLLERLLKRQRGSAPVTLHSAHAYGSMVRAYGYLGDVNGVWETWREMRKLRIPLTSVSTGCMVEALCSNGNPDAGYDFIREVMDDASTRPLMNGVIYGSVLKGYSHLKRFDRLWAVYKEMLDEGMNLSIVTYNTLVDACARNNEMRYVPELLDQMVKQGIEPNIITYSAIIKGYCHNRGLSKAFDLYEDMKRSKNAQPDEHTYNTLLNGCAQYGMYEKGIELLEEMQSAGVRPSNFTLSVLMKLCARSRRLSAAFELCDSVAAKHNIKPNVHVYNNLINACIMQREIPRAMELMERLATERVRPDARTYNILLNGCVSCNKGQEAADLLRIAMGLRSASTSLFTSRGALSTLQLKDGLPDDLVVEVVTGIKNQCRGESMTGALIRDIKQHQGQSARLVRRLVSLQLAA